MSRSSRAASFLLAACLLLLVCRSVSAQRPQSVSGPVVFTVTSADDSGPGTLRDAIDQANAVPGTGLVQIRFDITKGPPPVGDVWTITLETTLPTITRPNITIDALTQPGAECLSLIRGRPHALKVVLDGSMVTSNSQGITIWFDAHDVVVSGLVINNFSSSGVESRADRTTIACTYLGTDYLGSRMASNGSGAQLYGVESSITNSLVSGHSGGSGVGVRGDSIFVEGCLVGTDAAGETPLGNKWGISISGRNAVIGGTAWNLISGNAQEGIFVGEDVDGAWILGNRIGTDLAGLAPIPNGWHGIRVFARVDSIRIGGPGAGNLISGNLSQGIMLAGSNHVVQGNRIGIDLDGENAIPNLMNGIRVHSTGTLIGGAEPGEGNVISGNVEHGVWIQNDGVTVQRNTIGTNAIGTVAIPNGENGIRCERDCWIGGMLPGSGNLISGNLAAGIHLESSSVAFPTVTGNRIGTNAAGTLAIPNGGAGITGESQAQISGNLISGNGFHGIDMIGEGWFWIFGNMIGTDSAGMGPLPNQGSGVVARGRGLIGPHEYEGGASNLIAFNLMDGIAIVSGLDSFEIRDNMIHNNGGLGIDMGADGVSNNDGGSGSDPLPQDYPILQPLTSVGNTVQLEFTLESTPSTTFEVEMYRSEEPDPSGHGEGQTRMETIAVNTDPSGYASFSQSRPDSEYPVGSWISATASIEGTPWDPGQTSEFSPAQQVQGVSVRLNGRVLLEGPYAGSGSMSTSAVFHAAVPHWHPYHSPLFQGTICEHHGGESVTSVPPDGIDWVVLSLRITPSYLDEVARREAFVLADGTIADQDGSSPLQFDGILPDHYYVVVCHRNHLGIMSSAAVDFTTGEDNDLGIWDFTTAMDKAYGTNGMKGLGASGSSPFGMFAGNAIPDASVQALDFSAYQVQTVSGATGYESGDFNLDGNVQALDFNLYIANTVAGASSQVP